MIDIYCCVKSAAILGIEPYIVDIEADIESGLPYFNMVGLLASEVREARERVRSALMNINEALPVGRVVINLSPADIRKEGTRFDLPIAISLLCSMKRLNSNDFDGTLIVGELGLDGEIKSVKGILPIVNMAKKNGIKRCIIPYDNRKEGHLIDGVEIIAFGHLKDIISFYRRNDSNAKAAGVDYNKWNKSDNKDKRDNKDVNDNKRNDNKYSDDGINEKDISGCGRLMLKGKNLNKKNEVLDFSQIYGQETVKRAIMISVAGCHNLLMVGPPGVGKSMLASRIPTVMPAMTMDERIEVSGIHSICGLLDGESLVERRPFSSPHHTITGAALIGGGHMPRPGEITIAHKGVLFLDELPEFNPNVIDALRQPLEEGIVKIYRTGGSYVFPADCLLVAAMNPCKCGYYPDRNKCNCSEKEVNKYLSRISGPILDRIDLSVEVPRVSVDYINGENLKKNDINNFKNDYKNSYKSNHKDIGMEYKSGAKESKNSKESNEREHVFDICHSNLSSEDMRMMINNAIDLQMKRQGERRNGRLTIEEIRKYCMLDDECKQFMKEAYESFGLSMRGYNKVLKIARTIADIESEQNITMEHLTEALAYRIN